MANLDQSKFFQMNNSMMDVPKVNNTSLNHLSIAGINNDINNSEEDDDDVLDDIQINKSGGSRR